MIKKRIWTNLVVIPFVYIIAGLALGIAAIACVFLFSFVPGFFPAGFIGKMWKIIIVGSALSTGFIGWLYGLREYFLARKSDQS